MADRWATFDCYGTLIDWNSGIGRELERLFGVAAAARLLHRYHEVEPAVQAENPTRMYREVLDLALARLAATEGLLLPALESDALSRSLPGGRRSRRCPRRWGGCAPGVGVSPSCRTATPTCSRRRLSRSASPSN